MGGGLVEAAYWHDVGLLRVLRGWVRANRQQGSGQKESAVGCMAMLAWVLGREGVGSMGAVLGGAGMYMWREA